MTTMPPKIRLKRRAPPLAPERNPDGTFSADPTAPPKRRRGNPNMIKGGPSVNQTGRSNPAWYPGCPSPNPGGCPKEVKVIRDRIAELTRDGQDILEFFVETMKGKDAGADDPKVRLTAAEWLGAHYFGKPKQELGVSVEITEEQRAMLEALKLSPHERRGRIAELKARAATEIIDVPAQLVGAVTETDADTD